ncbi:MAG: YlbF family regulator [Lachnospiraceae bacterium]|nr:YlbF family regulator [Lachnospiraceae bacterium]
MYDYVRETEHFLGNLYESEICQKYFEQKERVKQYPELKVQIDEFRQRNYKLQNEVDSATLFDEIDRFECEYEEFRKNPIVSQYLEAELAFCRMYQEISNMINIAFAVEVD